MTTKKFDDYRECHDCTKWHYESEKCAPFCGPSSGQTHNHNWFEVDLVAQEKNQSSSVMICRRCGRSAIRIGEDRGANGYRDEESVYLVIFPGYNSREEAIAAKKSQNY